MSQRATRPARDPRAFRCSPRVAWTVLLASAAACGRDEAPSGAGTSAPPAAIAPADEIAAAGRDAIDLVILTHALTTLRGWGRTPELAPALKARVAPYEDRVQLDLAIEGVDDGVTPEGVRTAIPAGARFGATLGGALHAVVSIAGGEVGLVNGEVFIAESAIATVDGRTYRRTSGRWVAAGG